LSANRATGKLTGSDILELRRLLALQVHGANGMYMSDILELRRLLALQVHGANGMYISNTPQGV